MPTLQYLKSPSLRSAGSVFGRRDDHVAPHLFRRAGRLAGSEECDEAVVPYLVDFDPSSFPSGHSMGAALVYLTLGSIISRQVSGLRAKAYFLSVALVLAMIVGISRVYLGVHYPSDVLAGWAAGSLWSVYVPSWRVGSSIRVVWSL